MGMIIAVCKTYEKFFLSSCKTCELRRDVSPAYARLLGVSLPRPVEIKEFQGWFVSPNVHNGFWGEVNVAVGRYVLAVNKFDGTQADLIRALERLHVYPDVLAALESAP
jgi:hypothetical protein